jgi:hemerythrin-like domain-containing protein
MRIANINKLDSNININTKNNIFEILDRIKCHLNHIIKNLKDNDFENIKRANDEISKIINEINKSKQRDEIKPDQVNKIIDYLKDFIETLQNIEDCINN